MNEEKIKKAINNAVASVEMEGFTVDEGTKDLCRLLLLEEISFEQYINIVKKQAGIV